MTDLKLVQKRSAEVSAELSKLGQNPEAENTAITTLLKEQETLKNREAALIASEPPEKREKSLDDDRLRSVLRKVEVRQFLTAGLSEDGSTAVDYKLSGAASEVAQEFKVEPGRIPWAVLADVDEETTEQRKRADDLTSLTAVETLRKPMSWVERVFVDTDVSYCGVSMPSVADGTHSFPVISGGSDASTKARNTAAEANAFVLGAETLDNETLRVRYRLTQQDFRKFGKVMFDAAIRNDMRRAITSGMSREIINGVTSPAIPALVKAPTTNTNLTASVTGTDFLDALTGELDGKYAHEATDLRVLLKSSFYGALWRKALQFGPTAASPDYTSLMAFLGQMGIRTKGTGHLAYQGSNQNSWMLIIKMRGIQGAAVAPTWGGGPLVLVNPYSEQDKSVIAYDFTTFWNFIVARSDHFVTKRFKE